MHVGGAMRSANQESGRVTAMRLDAVARVAVVVLAVLGPAGAGLATAAAGEEQPSPTLRTWSRPSFGFDLTLPEHYRYHRAVTGASIGVWFKRGIDGIGGGVNIELMERDEDRNLDLIEQHLRDRGAERIQTPWVFDGLTSRAWQEAGGQVVCIIRRDHLLYVAAANDVSGPLGSRLAMRAVADGWRWRDHEPPQHHLELDFRPESMFDDRFRVAAPVNRVLIGAEGNRDVYAVLAPSLHVVFQYKVGGFSPPQDIALDVLCQELGRRLGSNPLATTPSWKPVEGRCPARLADYGIELETTGEGDHRSFQNLTAVVKVRPQVVAVIDFAIPVDQDEEALAAWRELARRMTASVHEPPPVPPLLMDKMQDSIRLIRQDKPELFLRLWMPADAPRHVGERWLGPEALDAARQAGRFEAMRIAMQQIIDGLSRPYLSDDGRSALFLVPTGGELQFAQHRGIWCLQEMVEAMGTGGAR